MTKHERLAALVGDGAWLRAIVLSLPEYALVIVDTDLRIMVAEGQPFDRSGVSLSGLFGQTVGEVLAGVPDVGRFEKHFRDGLDGVVSVADIEGLGLAARVRFGPVFDRAGDTAIGALALCAEVVGEGLKELARAKVLGLVEDERRSMQHRLAVADRMASLGGLTATLLHEIYNPLTAVMLAGELAREKLRRHVDAPAEHSVAPVFTQLEQMHEGIEQVLSLGRELRSFTATAPERPYPVELVSVVRSALRLCGHRLRYRARVIERFEPAPRVLGDERQLVQVVMNLVTNASQSFVTGDETTNTVTVRVGGDELGRALFAVEDNGPGVSEELREKIFEPFFTTRSDVEGCGLGLSIVRGIITGLGGSIELEPKSTNGAKFTVRLPPAPGSVTKAFVGETRTAVAREELSRGKLLVVEDEPVLAEALATLLSPEHEVDVETDPREALLRLRRGGSYDLILCDVVMPWMNGMELYATVCAERPELRERIVFLTAGGAMMHVKKFLSEVPNPRVEKPVSPEVLRRLVRTWVRGSEV